ncbi:hypothetical protein WICMUC_003803 [Wickerhamomyces mucosus]|uniref:C2 domain-containing protein n=1 Tax=Wickerhamomyces mucosus TaxID=1378264 RepID=A0A9P8PKD1_9ASCO|nr:hypothetical protein WICMUC_003803 [Wickerhamomyces mucosus]
MEKQNPYCLLRISNLTDKTKPVIRGGQSPRWEEELRFKITPEIQPILKLTILDETKKSPSLICETEIDFTPVFYSSIKEGYDKWYQLIGNNKEAGQIYLEMTFYPSNLPIRSNNNSSRKLKAFNTSTSPNKKRELPPVPGQQVEIKEEVEECLIPPPLPRSNASDRTVGSATSTDLLQNFDSNFSSSCHKPSFTQSIHSLPDVPSNFQPVIESRQERHGDDDSSKKDITSLSAEPELFRSAFDPGRNKYDFKSLAKKFTSKYNAQLFGGNDKDSASERSTSSKSSEFDELEREVQSDFFRNQPPLSVHRSPEKKAPPVPSHSSSNFNKLCPLPPQNSHHPNRGESEKDYLQDSAIRETDERSRITRSPSPSKKPPKNFYRLGSTSPARLNLSSDIPYDANNIDSRTSRKIPSVIGKRNEIRDGFSVRNDELLNHAPTPYDVFTEDPKFQNSLNSSTSSTRSSPSRFRST